MNNGLSVDSREFLLAQFNSASEKRSFYEERIESETQRIFTLVGGGIAIVGLVSQLGNSPILILGVVQLFAVILTIIGYRYIRLIPILMVHMYLHEAQAALIRRCFVDLDSSIRNYIILEIANANYYALTVRPVRSSLGVNLIRIFNSVTLAVALVLIPIDIQVLFGGSALALSDRTIWIAAAVAAIACGVWFFVYQGRVIAAAGGRYDDALKQRTKDMIETIDRANRQPEENIG